MDALTSISAPDAALPAVRRAWYARTELLLGLLLAGGLLVRLPFLAVDTGATNDLAVYRQWARLAQTTALSEIYTGRVVNYPPVLVYWFAAAGWLEARLTAGGSSDQVLNALLKLGPLAADLATALLLARAFGPHRPRLALVAAGLHLFNPAGWLVSSFWGQTDSVYALWLVAGCLALQRPAWVPAWLAFTLGVATKVQAAAAGPALWAASLRRGWRAWLPGALAAVALAVLGWLPWLAARTLDEALASMFDFANRVPWLNVSGLNVWFLLGLEGWPAEAHVPGLPLTFRHLSLALTAVYALPLAWAAWRRPRDLALPAATLCLGFYTFFYQVHERYLFPVLPLLLLAAAERPQQRWLWALYGVLTVTYTYNLLAVIPLDPAWWVNIFAPQPATPQLAALKLAGRLAAAVHVSAALWLAVWLAWDNRRPAAPSEAAA